MSLSPISGSAATQPALGVQQRQPPRPPKEVMDAAATALGVSHDELRQTLMGGSTLADAAKTRGVSTDDLSKAMVGAMKANKPAGAPELSDAQLTHIVGNFIVGKPPQRPPVENPVAAEFVRLAEAGDGQRRSGSLLDVRV